MNPAILTPEVQHYLQAHELTAPTEAALRKSPFATVSAAELAQQLDSRQRCRKKLPLWYDTPGIYYPEKLAVEQASSQAAADYKASLLPEGVNIIDLTGGFGVDTLFFAQRANKVVHCEKKESLADIARHNASVLGVHNIDFSTTDGPAYLQSQTDDLFDWAYIDPSRRVDKRKVFLLEDCEPNIVAAQDWLLQKAANMMLKSGPLLDISSALGVLHHVRTVHIVSIGNECKELLFVLDREYSGPPQMAAVAINEHIQKFYFTIDEERSAASQFGQPKHFLYEPDAALLKSGAFKLIGQQYGLEKLHQHTHLYTSENLVPNFIGRTFSIDSVMLYGDFKKDKKPIQGHISTRNFPLGADELRKRHRVREGGNTYLFFCTAHHGDLLVIFASKC